jgi:hypothetical protein
VARLARVYRREFVRRDRVDGTVEAVELRNGRLTHYLVYTDGTSE